MFQKSQNWMKFGNPLKLEFLPSSIKLSFTNCVPVMRPVPHKTMNWIPFHRGIANSRMLKRLSPLTSFMFWIVIIDNNSLASFCTFGEYSSCSQKLVILFKVLLCGQQLCKKGNRILRYGCWQCDSFWVPNEIDSWNFQHMLHLWFREASQNLSLIRQLFFHSF